MIQKIVKKLKLSDFNEEKDNLSYWLSKTPEERIAIVEFLRKQNYGSTTRLQRVIRVIQRQ